EAAVSGDGQRRAPRCREGGADGDRKAKAHPDVDAGIIIAPWPIGRPIRSTAEPGETDVEGREPVFGQRAPERSEDRKRCARVAAPLEIRKDLGPATGAIPVSERLE